MSDPADSPNPDHLLRAPEEAVRRAARQRSEARAALLQLDEECGPGDAWAGTRRDALRVLDEYLDEVTPR